MLATTRPHYKKLSNFFAVAWAVMGLPLPEKKNFDPMSSTKRAMQMQMFQRASRVPSRRNTCYFKRANMVEVCVGWDMGVDMDGPFEVVQELQRHARRLDLCGWQSVLHPLSWWFSDPGYKWTRDWRHRGVRLWVSWCGF